jgi:hypothetical protein
MKNFYQKRGGVSKQDRLLPKPEDAAVSLDGLVKTGCCPNAFSLGSETFFDKSKAYSRRCQNSPFGLKQLTSLVFRFAKIYEQKTFQ